MTPWRAGLALDVFKYTRNRRLVGIGQVHGDLRQAAHRHTHSLYVTQATVGKAHGLGNLLRYLDIGRIEIHVVSDQKFARAYNRCARRRMQFAVAKVGLPCRIGLQLLANALELAATHILQVLTLGHLRGRLVQVNRHVIPLPDFFAGPPGNGDAIFQRHTFDGNKRDHVGRAQTGMSSRVFGEVNKLDSLANAADCGFRHIHRIADQRDNTAVVVGVHLAVEQIHAIHLHGIDNGVDSGFVAAFRKVGDTFDECGHKR